MRASPPAVGGSGLKPQSRVPASGQPIQVPPNCPAIDWQRLNAPSTVPMSHTRMSIKIPMRRRVHHEDGVARGGGKSRRIESRKSKIKSRKSEVGGGNVGRLAIELGRHADDLPGRHLPASGGARGPVLQRRRRAPGAACWRSRSSREATNPLRTSIAVRCSMFDMRRDRHPALVLYYGPVCGLLSGSRPAGESYPSRCHHGLAQSTADG